MPSEYAIAKGVSVHGFPRGKITSDDNTIRWKTPIDVDILVFPFARAREE
jgi:hypothetical protein